MNNSCFANKLNTHYTNIGGERLPVERIPECPLSPCTVSIGEVKSHLRRLDTTKATHTEDFPSFISRDNCEDIAVPLTDVINCMFQQCTYPAKWKCAQVVPLKKTSSPSGCKDYRPISLLWHCGKVAEHFYLKYLRPSVTPMLQSNQYAYQPGKGTVDALISALHDWTGLLDGRENVSVLFADFSKAFDLMQTSHLVSAMTSLNIRYDLVKIAESFLSGRSQTVRINGTTSEQLPMNVGVAQGTLCGPWFWLIFSDSFAPPNQIKCIRYADDTTCYWPTPRTACGNSSSQICASYAHSWSEQHGMLLNVAKTKTMSISTSTPSAARTTMEVQPTIQDTPIGDVTEFKFLGVVVDNRLNFNSHCQTISTRANQRQQMLLKLKRNGVCSDKLVLFYLSNIRSILTYCAPAFYTMLSKKQTDLLEGIQRMCTRTILPGVLSYTERLSILGVPVLQDFIMDMCQRYFSKIMNDDSHVLHNLLPLKRDVLRQRRSACSRSFMVPRTRLQVRERSFIIHFSKQF